MPDQVEPTKQVVQGAQPVTPQAKNVPDETKDELQALAVPYPPCLFKTPEEKRLYSRLREIYQQHYHTWDKESRDAWPSAIEHASLAPSTILKVTSHTMAKNLTVKNVTWAQVVVLRVIFKSQLYKSKKTMKIIMTKYPRANFHTYAFSEDYKLPAVELPPVHQEDTAKQTPAVEQKNDAPAPVKVSKPKVAIMKHEEGDISTAPPKVKKEAKAAKPIKREDRDKSPASGFLNLPQYPGNPPTAPTKKRKQATSDAAGDAAEKSGADSQRPQKARKVAPASGNSAPGPKPPSKKPVVKSEGQRPQKSEVREPALASIPAAKKTKPRKDSSNAAPTSGTRIENPLKTIERRLGETDKDIDFLKKLVATQDELIKALQKQVKEIEQNLPRAKPRAKKVQKTDVKQSIEKAPRTEEKGGSKKDVKSEGGKQVSSN